MLNTHRFSMYLHSHFHSCLCEGKVDRKITRTENMIPAKRTNVPVIVVEVVSE